MTPVVLYVEDDVRSCRVMQLLLKHQMKLEHVTIFEDSQDFTTRVDRLHPVPTVIFLDIHLKPYSGFEMLEMLRHFEKFKYIPIVALTASVMNEEIQQLHVAGFNGCIAKPINIDTFPGLFDRIMRGEEVWSIMD